MEKAKHLSLCCSVSPSAVATSHFARQSARVEYADKSEADTPDERTGGQVEVTYLLSLLLRDEIFALVIGDMLLAQCVHTSASDGA